MMHGLPNVGMTLHGCVDESKDCTVTELCECTFSDIVMSKKFAQLCNLLIENFQGVKANKLFDFNNINSRMMDNIYGSSLLRFQLDLQEIWTKLQKVVSDITSLAKCLSKKTTAFHEEDGSTSRGINKDSKFKCSPDYAYGPSGFQAWGIQPNLVLVFEIKVLSIELSPLHNKTY